MNAPNASDRVERSAIWNANQRRVLVVLLLAVAVYLTVRYVLNPSYVSDPQPRTPSRYFDLADKIDPNDADWPTLAALPNIGEKRAKEIVAFRDQFRAQHPDQLAFAREDDLYRIKGIGPSIVLQVRPYLIFPSRSAATTRAAD